MPSVHPLRRGQKQEGTERGEDRVDFRGGKGTKGKGNHEEEGQRGGHKRALRRPEARKADFANVVTLNKRVRWPLVTHGETALCVP